MDKLSRELEDDKNTAVKTAEEEIQQMRQDLEVTTRRVDDLGSSGEQLRAERRALMAEVER